MSRRIISFEIPDTLFDDLAALADRMGCARSLILRWATQEYIEGMRETIRPTNHLTEVDSNGTENQRRPVT